MSDTFTHVPWFVTNSRISARIGSDDWQDTRRGESAWHSDAAPTFRPRRNIATRVARRADRAHARRIMRAQRWDDLTTHASMSGETPNARALVMVSRNY